MVRRPGSSVMPRLASVVVLVHRDGIVGVEVIAEGSGCPGCRSAAEFEAAEFEECRKDREKKERPLCAPLRARSF